MREINYLVQLGRLKPLEERFEAITHKATFMMEMEMGLKLELEMKLMMMEGLEMEMEMVLNILKIFFHTIKKLLEIFKIMAVGIQ